MLHVPILRGIARLLPAALIVLAAAALFVPGVALGETAPTVDSTVTTAGTATTVGSTAASAADPTSPGSVVVPKPGEVEALNPGVVFESMNVQIWPEYDRPEVLVMIDLVLPADASFPFKFRFGVPKGAAVTGVAEVNPNGSFDYSRPQPLFDTTAPDRDLVSVEIPKNPNVRLEYYYDPGLNVQGARDYNLLYELFGDAKQVSLVLQQPLRSDGFVVTPPLSESSKDGQGFSYAGQSFSNLKSGDRLQLRVAYTKENSEPSVQPGETAPGGGTSRNSLLALLVILVVGVGGFAAYRLFLRPQPAASGRGGRPAAARSTARNRSSGARSRAVAAERNRPAGGPARFCTSCGAQLTKKDRFCPQCGSAREV